MHTLKIISNPCNLLVNNLITGLSTGLTAEGRGWGEIQSGLLWLSRNLKCTGIFLVYLPPCVEKNEVLAVISNHLYGTLNRH